MLDYLNREYEDAFWLAQRRGTPQTRLFGEGKFFRESQNVVYDIRQGSRSGTGSNRAMSDQARQFALLNDTLGCRTAQPMASIVAGPLTQAVGRSGFKE